MASLRSKEITETKSSPGSSHKVAKRNSPAVKIPGPGRLETFRRLFPNPITAFPIFLVDITRRFGGVVAFDLPWRSFLFVNEPDAIKDVLVTHQHAFVKSEGGRALRYLLGEGLLTSEEPLHRERRRAVQPAFHHQKVAAFAETMRSYAADWAVARRDGETFDMAALMGQLTLRVASNTLFGIDASGEAETVRAALFETMETYPSAIGPLGKIRRSIPWWPSTVRFNKAKRTLDEILYRLIAERRANPTERNDALSMLLELDDVALRDEAMTLFLAGYETTANAMLWSWTLLARNPHVEEKFLAAVDSDDDEYIRRVFKEAMRLYPPAWILGREALRDVTLAGGYNVPAKTTVFISQLILQRSETYYRDPLDFAPDRWLDADVPQYAYAPFGAGARRCIGEEFAWMEGVLLLKTIARRWRFEMSDSGEPAFDALVTLRPSHPVMMRAIAR